MTLNRPPRIPQPLPRVVVSLPELPRQPASSGGMNWLTVGLPAAALLLSMLVFGALGQGGLSQMVRFLPLVLVGSIGSLLTFSASRRSSRKALAESRRVYQERVEAARRRLSSLSDEQRRILERRHPGPAGCLALVREGDLRLGERRPADEDFLCLRLGLGDVPTSFLIERPSSRVDAVTNSEEVIQEEVICREYARLAGAPCALDLRRTGFLGIVGERNARERLAQALWIEAAVFHWPTELRMSSLLREAESRSWEGLEALPHAPATRNLEPSSGGTARSGVWAGLEALLDRQINEFSQASIGHLQGEAALPASLVLMEAPVEAPDAVRLAAMVEQGPSRGIFGLVLAEAVESLPGGCGAIAVCTKDRIELIDCREDGHRIVVRADDVDPRLARGLSGSLARAGVPSVEQQHRLPEIVRLTELFGAQAPCDLPVESWWRSCGPDGLLRAPIGILEGGERLIFDLNDHEAAHGPHGLIGGMTGSGKSELLRVMLLSLALTHSPRRVNFALVDFKGGAAFGGLTGLPHTVGVVTDIENHESYAERVIQCLMGEAERRKRLLEAARVDYRLGRAHIDDLWRLPVHPVLPRLVVVFDEFAEFRQRHPVESRRLISIARQGRSLGIHLILATQNIAAAIDPEIRQNSSFLICLRVAEAADSQHLIGIPDAVDLPRGRAFLHAHGTQIFQSAFTGGELAPGLEYGAPGQVTIVHPGGRKEVRPIALTGDKTGVEVRRITEAEGLIERVLRAASAIGMGETSVVWPPPLPVRLALPDLLAEWSIPTWDGNNWPEEASAGNLLAPVPIFGLADRPLERKQELVLPQADQGSGHVLVFGAAGTGKSTALRTAAVSLAMRHSPELLHLYVLDLASQPALRILECLPHVGAVVLRTEEERIERLLRWLSAEVERRIALFRQARVDRWSDYALRVANSDLPAIYLLVDSIGDARRSPVPDLAKRLSGLVGAASLGIHLVVSAALQADITMDLFSNISFRLCLHQADPTEYLRTVGRPGEARLQEEQNSLPPPGRGFLRGNPPVECQVAQPLRGHADFEQIQALQSLGSGMCQSWTGTLPSVIPTLASWVSFSPGEPRACSESGGPPAPDWIPLGVEHQGLQPAGLSLSEEGPGFLLAGVSPKCGKTTLLRHWLLHLVERLAPTELQLLLCDFHCRTLTAFRHLPHCFGYVSRPSEIEPIYLRLHAEVERRRRGLEYADGDKEPEDPLLLMVADDYDVLCSTDEGATRLLRQEFVFGKRLRLGCLLSGNAAELPRDFDDPLMAKVRRNGCGVLLGGVEGIEQFNNSRRPVGQPSGGLPPGRGFLIRHGRIDLIQAAHFADQGENPQGVLEQRLWQIANRAETVLEPDGSVHCIGQT